MTIEDRIARALDDYAWIRAHCPEAQVRVLQRRQSLPLVFVEWHNDVGALCREGAVASEFMLCAVLHNARDRMESAPPRVPSSREPAVAIPTEEKSSCP